MKKIHFIFLTASFLLSGYNNDRDAHGYIWTPDGFYDGPASAYFNSEKEFGKLTMGNYCEVEGKLTHPDKNESVFKLEIDDKAQDGFGCPFEKFTITIKILDGYAIHAFGNASKIELIQKNFGEKFADFSGIYTFDYEKDL